jgi:hypothetical protein
MKLLKYHIVRCFNYGKLGTRPCLVYDSVIYVNIINVTFGILQLYSKKVHSISVYPVSTKPFLLGNMAMHYGGKLVIFVLCYAKGVKCKFNIYFCDRTQIVTLE